MAVEKIFSINNLNEGWKAIKSKKRGGGIDYLSIEDFASKSTEYLAHLQQELLSGNYTPEPYKLFFIQKSNSEYRPIGAMTIKDKIVQYVVKVEYEREIDKVFSNRSYAYRPNKSHGKAINRISDILRKNYEFAITLDIDKFFDTINRKNLFSVVKLYFPESYIQKLIEMWVITGMVSRNKFITSEVGIAQGGILSPLLSNLYLNRLDHELEAHSVEFVRYADNIICFSKSKEEAEYIVKNISEYLKNELSLTLNDTKDAIHQIKNEFTFCGITFKENKRIISDSKMNSLKSEIRKMVREGLQALPTKWRLSLEGIERYYSPYEVYTQFRELDIFTADLLHSKISEEVRNKKLNNLASGHNICAQIKTLTHLLNGNGINFKDLILNPQAIPDLENVPKEPEVKITYSENKETAVRKTLQKKVEYLRRFGEQQELIVSGMGCIIGKRGGNIIVRREGKVLSDTLISKVNSITIIGKGISISSDAIALCVENKKQLWYLNGRGEPYASISGLVAPTLTLSQKQAHIAQSEEGVFVAASLIIAKIKNQIALLKYIIKNKDPEDYTRIDVQQHIEQMLEIIETIKHLNFKEDYNEIRSKIFGYEGSAAINYWASIKILLSPYINFPGRTHRGSSDPVNCSLNYAYGMLYPKVAGAITKTGLNPNMSFLHKEQKKEATLVFDMIEPFRAAISDRAVITMFTKGFKPVVEDGYLDGKSRKAIASKVIYRMFSEVVFQGKRQTLLNVITEQSTMLARVILADEVKKFKVFIQKW